MLAPLMPQATPYPDKILEPDFRRMVISSPASDKLEAALSAIGDYSTRQEMTNQARWLERDLTNFDIQRREFAKECADMKLANERRLAGTLSDAPEALKLLRRNLQGDLDRWRAILDGDKVQGQAIQQPPILEEIRDLAGAAAAQKVKQLTTAQKNAVKQFKADKERQDRKANGDRIRNQLMTEVRQMMKSSPSMTQSAACLNIAQKHLDASGKPLVSKRTLENWMSAAKTKRKRK